jgi:hypothetical protein
MTDKKAMKLALDALETEVSIDWTNNDEFNASAEKMHEAIAALKERLAQPEQEPLAHLWECLGRWSAYLVDNGVQADCAPPSWLVDAVKNATTPPQRPWVGLTDEDDIDWEEGGNLRDLVKAIEAKLKQKNGYAEEKNT